MSSEKPSGCDRRADGEKCVDGDAFGFGLCEERVDLVAMVGAAVRVAVAGDKLPEGPSGVLVVRGGDLVSGLCEQVVRLDLLAALLEEGEVRLVEGEERGVGLVVLGGVERDLRRLRLAACDEERRVLDRLDLAAGPGGCELDEGDAREPAGRRL